MCYYSCEYLLSACIGYSGSIFSAGRFDLFSRKWRARHWLIKGMLQNNLDLISRNRGGSVYEQSGYQYKPTPTIVLKGKWLEELGFCPGTPVVVKCQGGQLTITPADEVAVTE